jgi:F0F1-type ATP synthase assembly protein I
MELVAGILLWAGLGYLADQALGTGPWLLGIGALVGYAGGLWLVWLRSQRMEDHKPDRFDRRQSL